MQQPFCFVNKSIRCLRKINTNESMAYNNTNPYRRAKQNKQQILDIIKNR